MCACVGTWSSRGQGSGQCAQPPARTINEVRASQERCTAGSESRGWSSEPSRMQALGLPGLGLQLHNWPAGAIHPALHPDAAQRFRLPASARSARRCTSGR